MRWAATKVDSVRSIALSIASCSEGHGAGAPVRGLRGPLFCASAKVQACSMASVVAAVQRGGFAAAVPSLEAGWPLSASWYRFTAARSPRRRRRWRDRAFAFGAGVISEERRPIVSKSGRDTTIGRWREEKAAPASPPSTPTRVQWTSRSETSTWSILLRRGASRMNVRCDGLSTVVRAHPH